MTRKLHRHFYFWQGTTYFDYLAELPPYAKNLTESPMQTAEEIPSTGADILHNLFFENKDAVERFNGNFSAYFDECTGKNGTLEIIERNWGDLRV